MSASALPKINTLVDVSLIDGSSYPSRVEGADDRLLTVAAPYDLQDAERPEVGAALDVVWLCDGSRLVAPARFTSVTREQPPRWLIQVVGESRLQTRRAYMRGGGGERIRLTRRGGDTKPVQGHVIDISEGSARCRIRSCDYAHDDILDIAITLGSDVVEHSARVLSVRHNPDTDDYDVVVTYETTEAIGRTIRGYILRRQMQERRRLAG